MPRLRGLRRCARSARSARARSGARAVRARAMRSRASPQAAADEERTSRAFRLRNVCTSQPSEIEARSSSSSNSSASRWMSSARSPASAEAEAERTTRQRPVRAMPMIAGKHDAAAGAEIGAEQQQRQLSAWRRRSRRQGRPAAASRRCAAGRRRKRRRARAPRSRTCRRSHSRSERAMRHQPPAPDRDRQHQHDRGQPEKLDQQIGCDRAGRAEQIADRRVGGVAEARILHRPGRERERADRRESTSSARPRISREPAADRAAEIVGEKVDLVETAVIDRCHDALTRARRRGDAAPRPWSALSCTMATRI